MTISYGPMDGQESVFDEILDPPPDRILFFPHTSYLIPHR